MSRISYGGFFFTGAEGYWEGMMKINQRRETHDCSKLE
jgi:hypothetical protein